MSGNTNTTAPLQPTQTNMQGLPAATMFLQKKGLLGAKSAKTMSHIVSPTDNVLSPCSAKLSGAKQRHFVKAKPMGLNSQLSQLAASGSNDSPAKERPRAEF